eukprot:s19_g51.t1
MVWGAMRCDDVQAVLPSRMLLSNFGLRLVLGKSKTSGPDKIQKEVSVHIMRNLSLTGEDWLKTGYDIWSQDPFNFRRDYLVMEPNKDWANVKRKFLPPSGLSSAMSKLLSSISAPKRVAFGWELMPHTLLLPDGLEAFYSGHSPRNFVTSVAAAIGFSRDERAYLGRWSMGMVSSEEYVRTSRQVVFKIQRAVNRSLIEGKEEQFFEDEVIGKLCDYALSLGANPNRIKKRHCVMSNWTGRMCLGGLFPALEVIDGDWQPEEHGDPPEVLAEKVATLARKEVNAKAHVTKFFITVSRRNSLRRLLSFEFPKEFFAVAIARHYGSLRKFSALGDDRPAIRTSCLQDFAIPADTPENRSQIAAIVSAWETSKEYMAKEIELKAEAKVLGQPRVLQIHERQAMLRAVELVHGSLGEAECPSADYLSLKGEETECNEPTAAPLDEILSKQVSSSSQIQSAVDTSGHIRVTRTKCKAKMPSSTEEYRKIMRVEMFAWLCMASRYKAKHWLHGLTAEPFDLEVKIRPDWSIVLAYEQKLRKEAMKRVLEGHTLADSLIAVTKDSDLKEAYFTTPVALKAASSEQQPNKWSRFNSKGSSGGSFGGKHSFNFPKGKSKGKGKSKAPSVSDQRLKGLSLAWRTPDGRELCFAWNSGNCDGTCGRVGASEPSQNAPSLPPPAQPSQDIPTVKLMYLFAGKSRRSDVAAFLRQAEAAGKCHLILKEFDIERSPDHDLRNAALWKEIYSTLEEGGWTVIVSPPCNTFSRARFQVQHPGPKPLRNRTWPRGFPWLSDFHRSKVDEANFFVDQCFHACEVAVAHKGHFILEHPEDLGVVHGEHPGSIWQWQELLDLIPKCHATCFAIHQCHFGGLTPKPTRFLTSFTISDSRCFIALPKFDKFGVYKGPLPRKCGHVHRHKLIGKTAQRWNTAPSAAYPPGLCEFLAGLVSSGGGVQNKSCSGKGKRACDSKSTESVAKKQKTDAVLVEDEKQKTDTDVVVTEDDIEVISDGEAQAEVGQFDVAACGNSGMPIQVEWDSPTRWKPSQRGGRRSAEMVALADATFQLFCECVDECIPNVRGEAFKLVTGKLAESPFAVQAVDKLRRKFSALLPDKVDAMVLDDGQPFFLRALAQWLKLYNDPDVEWLVDVEDSFATGVCVEVSPGLPSKG